MKNNIKNEFVQRIASHYVSNDCIQVTEKQFSDTITILNSDGMTYHTKPNSNLSVNNYVLDERRNKFPYSEIEVHYSRHMFQKIKKVNQLYDFNRVYLKISDNRFIESYAIKDGNEALLVTKILIPEEASVDYMSLKEIEELINKTNGNIYALDGSCYDQFKVFNSDDLLKMYKKYILDLRNHEIAYNHNNYGHSLEELTDYINKHIDSITVDDIPSDLYVSKGDIFVSVENGEIQSVKIYVFKFISDDYYQVESYNLPITIYTYDQAKELEQTSFQKTKETKISRLLNPDIDKNVIKRERKRLLSMTTPRV